MAEQKRWTVTTSGGSLKDVADKLSEAGFSIDQILTEIGCVTGIADEKVVERARRIHGVSDISEEVVFDVGRPEDPETW